MEDQWNEIDEYQEQASTDIKMTTMRRRIKDLEVENEFLNRQMDHLLAENFELRKQQTTNVPLPPADADQQNLFLHHLQTLKGEAENLQGHLETLRDRLKPS